MCVYIYTCIYICVYAPYIYLVTYTIDHHCNRTRRCILAQCNAVHFSVCRAWQCIAICCSVLQHTAPMHSWCRMSSSHIQNEARTHTCTDVYTHCVCKWTCTCMRVCAHVHVCWRACVAHSHHLRPIRSLHRFTWNSRIRCAYTCVCACTCVHVCVRVTFRSPSAVSAALLESLKCGVRTRMRVYTYASMHASVCIRVRALMRACVRACKSKPRLLHPICPLPFHVHGNLEYKIRFR